MMDNLIIMIMFTVNTFMLFMMHPLSMTLMIVMQTINVSLLMGMLSYSYWFSYILFLIFLGGMLVLFIYMTSLASNELFNLPIKLIITTTTILLMLIMIMLLSNHFLLNIPKKQDHINNYIVNNSELPHNLSQLYNLPSMNITIMMITYLLITLIVIVKITEIQQGPLRQQF